MNLHYVPMLISGSMESIRIWLHAIMAIGTLTPIGLILFIFAFTGYDKRL